MRKVLVACSFTVVLGLVGTAVHAQHGPGGMHGGGPKGPVGGGPQRGPQSGGPHGPQAGGRAPDAGAGHGPGTAGPKGGDHGGRHGSTTGTPGTGALTTSPIAQKIEQHPQLASRLEALLPSGMTLNEAAAGFKNQGQFIAALHVSKNLGLSFADLKTQMVTNHKSLGQSIQALKPTTNATTETKLAEGQAHDDLENEGPVVKAPKTPGAREQGDH